MLRKRGERWVLSLVCAEPGRESADGASFSLAGSEPAAEDMLACELATPELLEASRRLCLLRWLCGASGEGKGRADVLLSVRRCTYASVANSSSDKQLEEAADSRRSNAGGGGGVCVVTGGEVCFGVHGACGASAVCCAFGLEGASESASK